MNLLHGHRSRISNGLGSGIYNESDDFVWLQHFPVDRYVGYSIAVFDISIEEATLVRKTLGFEPLFASDEDRRLTKPLVTANVVGVSFDK